MRKANETQCAAWECERRRLLWDPTLKSFHRFIHSSDSMAASERETARVENHRAFQPPDRGSLQRSKNVAGSRKDLFITPRNSMTIWLPVETSFKERSVMHSKAIRREILFYSRPKRFKHHNRFPTCFDHHVTSIKDMSFLGVSLNQFHRRLFFLKHRHMIASIPYALQVPHRSTVAFFFSCRVRHFFIFQVGRLTLRAVSHLGNLLRKLPSISEGLHRALIFTSLRIDSQYGSRSPQTTFLMLCYASNLSFKIPIPNAVQSSEHFCENGVLRQSPPKSSRSSWTIRLVESVGAWDPIVASSICDLVPSAFRCRPSPAGWPRCSNRTIRRPLIRRWSAPTLGWTGAANWVRAPQRDRERERERSLTA